MKETEIKYSEELKELEGSSSLRTLVATEQEGTQIKVNGEWMLNLSGNDYLGIAAERKLRTKFLKGLNRNTLLPSASSSRLLTGNSGEYEELESLLCSMFGSEAALVFNSGYHMNVGILPAVADKRTLILADKLVHASIIDGMRLSAARCYRYRHNDYKDLKRLIRSYNRVFHHIIIVTESIFSMDGDEADLKELVKLKKKNPKVMLYVDEAHAIGVRGENGLGCAEEQGCIGDIDFLCGTFGKALASVGAYVICSSVMREYLVNKMRSLIFSTALPPMNLRWTRFVLEQLPKMKKRREYLHAISNRLRETLIGRGFTCSGTSHIIPIITGGSDDAVILAAEMRRRGFYVLPVRPPTVPEGTSRIRLSLSAGITKKEMEQLIEGL